MSTDVLERATDLGGESADSARPVVGVDVSRPARHRLILTAIVAFGPPVTAVVVVARMIGRPVPWFPLALAVVFLAVIGHGVTIGFHRLFTHRSFEASRPLKITLGILGTMSFQGSLIGWVADHRRHHRYPDRPGDPHSPLWIGATEVSGRRGFWHAHIGWCFNDELTSRAEYVPDLLADPDLVLIDRLFVPCCIATLALPFAIGYAWSGTLGGAVAALLFAGVIRVGISHNFTWSINSVCHRFGTRSFRTRDASTNVAFLAPFTMGESWHNNHHAFPRLARHGVDRGQLDSSAALIRLFERLGWATNVQWPDRAQLDARRLPA
jgi:stearoyl-CoA desaturase (Delta-9 desaturase)